MGSMISSMSAAFSHGGFLMWAIVPVQIVSLAIIAERVMALYFRRQLNQKSMVQIFESEIRKGQIDKVIAQAKRIESEPIAVVALAGAQATQDLAGKDEVQLRMDEVLLEEQTRLEKRTGFLAMLGNVATLLGLLGTITGMIKSFAAVGSASATEKAALLAAGISEAMNATAYGLIVAVPALVMYAVLQNRTNQLQDDLNKSSFESYMTEIGIVKKGESGYYRSDLTPVYGEDGKQFVEELNQKGGITKAQEAAMLAGSMFGWQTPAADPRNYDEQGQPIKRKNKDRGEAR